MKPFIENNNCTPENCIVKVEQEQWSVMRLGDSRGDGEQGWMTEQESSTCSSSPESSPPLTTDQRAVCMHNTIKEILIQ